MKKTTIYIGLTLGLVLTAVLVTLIWTRLRADEYRQKGYSVTTFSPPTDADPEYLEKLRTYQTFSLTSDTTLNELTIEKMSSYLNSLKKSGDSLHGVHVVMTNDMPYKYYLKSVEIFNQLPPRLFFTVDNNFYAISKSKFQRTRDSILKIEAHSDGIEVVEIDGHEH
jgi:hypothetical protein